MKSLKINTEFLYRHLGVCLLMFGLGCWFGYDGFVEYPKTPAAELYEQIEKSKPPEGFALEAFKRQKIKSQYGFSALCLVASVLIGLHFGYHLAIDRIDTYEGSGSESFKTGLAKRVLQTVSIFHAALDSLNTGGFHFSECQRQTFQSDRQCLTATGHHQVAAAIGHNGCFGECKLTDSAIALCQYQALNGICHCR